MNKQFAFQPSPRQQGILREMLIANLGLLSEDTLRELEEQYLWVTREGGEVLFKDGDPGDSAYFLVSGRLRAVRTEPSGKRHLLGDIKPGETVGEVAVLSDATRSATVVAARDSVLVRVESEQLRKWFVDYPHLSLKIAKLLIKRGTSDSKKHRRDDHVTNIAIVPITPRVDMAALKARLKDAIRPYGNALVLDSGEVDRLSGESGIADIDKEAVESYERLSAWLEEQEARHDFVIYIANREGDAWTHRCLRRADRMVLLADPRDESAPSEFERTVVEGTSKRLIANTFLAINHPAATSNPVGTAAWLGVRPWVSEPIHIRDGDASHMARLVRLITGNAIGLVLGSGGARGLSQAGVIRALSEAGIPIDRVGGTSIGAVMAAGVASGWTAEQVDRNTRHSFGQNPTNIRDMSLPPLISMYSGKRLVRLLDEFFCEPMAIEDLWISFFCVSCDISNNSQAVHLRGPLRRSICASVALPGVFPPVRLGDGLHVDGAFMNALPVDVMGSLGVNKIIAIDLGLERNRTFDFDETPAPFEFFFDKFVRRNKRRYRVPTIVSAIIQSSLLASEAKDVQARIDADLLFNPEVHGFDIMAWSSCGKLIDIGYEHARKVLAVHAQTAVLSGHGAQDRPVAAQLPDPAEPTSADAAEYKVA